LITRFLRPGWRTLHWLFGFSCIYLRLNVTRFIVGCLGHSCWTVAGLRLLAFGYVWLLRLLLLVCCCCRLYYVVCYGCPVVRWFVGWVGPCCQLEVGTVAGYSYRFVGYYAVGWLALRFTHTFGCCCTYLAVRLRWLKTGCTHVLQCPFGCWTAFWPGWFGYLVTLVIVRFGARCAQLLLRFILLVPTTFPVIYIQLRFSCLRFVGLDLAVRICCYPLDVVVAFTFNVPGCCLLVGFGCYVGWLVGLLWFTLALVAYGLFTVCCCTLVLGYSYIHLVPVEHIYLRCCGLV